MYIKEGVGEDFSMKGEIGVKWKCYFFVEGFGVMIYKMCCLNSLYMKEDHKNVKGLFSGEYAKELVSAGIY